MKTWILAICLAGIGLAVAIDIIVTRSRPRLTHKTEDGCRFTPPGHWQYNSYRWLGNCKQGVADGLGILIGWNDSGERGAKFYGQLFDGRDYFGIIEQGLDDMHIADFEDGKPSARKHVGYLSLAYTTGAKAADLISSEYAAKGDPDLSHYYADRADRMRLELESD